MKTLTLLHQYHILFAVLFGFILDLLIGDPRWLYHPVRIIGKWIEIMEKITRGLFRTDGSEEQRKIRERTAGICTAISVILVSTLIPYLFLTLLYRVYFPAGFVLETFWCYQILATRSLRDESMKVYDALQTGDLEKSRYAVSMIVGRDTDRLDEQGVTKACVETIAENASDGVIAPLIFLMIGGAAGGFFYKSVNTMDSMIGYRNDKYRWFGTFAARLDDVLNFIPARLGGILMVVSAFLCGFDGINAWKIFVRDRKKHASPNSAHTESATAGALDISLAGDAWYFGELHRKETLGDPIREIEPEDIRRANRLMIVTAVLSLILCMVLRLLIMFYFL